MREMPAVRTWVRVSGLAAIVCGALACGDSASATTPADETGPALDGDHADVASEVGEGNDTGVDDASSDSLKAKPTITSFVATPASITVGDSSTLTWSASDGALTLDGAAVTGTSLVVKPTLTTEYTLTATNGAGSVSASATVTVSPSSVPTKPISYKKNQPFTVDSGTTNYVFVPTAYDASNATPITLFVWLHGCGGMSSGDIWVVSPGGSTQTWISLAVGGQEGNCWDVNNDPARVLAAIADLKTHFNIKPKGVILGGYSSGGDLTYRTAFYNADSFAGILVENTSPFRDTGSTQSASLAAASWKFNAVHLAHLQDTTYPIAGVRKETDAVIAAGFPLKRIETDGGHYDDAGAIENGHAVPGTDADLQTILLPYLDAGWTAP